MYTNNQQQRQQHGQGSLQGVTQLPGIIEGCSWCPDIFFDHPELIGTGLRTAQCTPTPTTMQQQGWARINV